MSHGFTWFTIAADYLLRPQRSDVSAKISWQPVAARWFVCMVAYKSIHLPLFLQKPGRLLYDKFILKIIFLGPEIQISDAHELSHHTHTQRAPPLAWRARAHTGLRPLCQ